MRMATLGREPFPECSYGRGHIPEWVGWGTRIFTNWCSSAGRGDTDTATVQQISPLHAAGTLHCRGHGIFARNIQVLATDESQRERLREDSGTLDYRRSMLCYAMLKGMLYEVNPLSRGRDLHVQILQLRWRTALRGMGWDDFIMSSTLVSQFDGLGFADQGVGRLPSASIRKLSPPASDLRPRLSRADGPSQASAGQNPLADCSTPRGVSYLDNDLKHCH